MFDWFMMYFVALFVSVVFTYSAYFVLDILTGGNVVIKGKKG